MAANLKLLDTKAKRVTHTSNDTLLITPETVKEWLSPPFQRPLKINEKVRQLADEFKANDGVLPGIITLGILDKATYLLDGQHRREAFLISGLAEGYTDVRKHVFESMADMGDEFVKLNSHIVPLKPDDIMRGLEGTILAIAAVRKACPFVGYDMIRRGDKSPILSMSKTLRNWAESATDTPSSTCASGPVVARAMTDDDTKQLIDFLSIAVAAWGRDPEYATLWGALNLTLTMWFYRRLVLSPPVGKTPRLTKEQFRNCLMAMSADGNFVEWLRGRKLSERDRSPAFGRMKSIFARRLEEVFGKKPSLPQPAWAHHLTGARP